ncbi:MULTISPECIES: hypothetical protein [Pseudomonas]|uniref:DUF3885 domain-containing protein n=1 Tax=Pseudomonas TaxID=286 RepID=UPI0011C49155|nr:MULTISPECIES: hypothetical protein [Pseudomonas]
MNLELEIERVFGGKAFVRPLFYSYPGGLRFALSETGGVIEQFLSALQKSTKICSDVFVGETALVACLRIHSGSNQFAHRAAIQALRSAGIDIPTERSVWSEEIDPAEWYCENDPEYWINVAFEGKRPGKSSTRSLR